MLRLTFKIKKDFTKDELHAEVCNKNKINIKTTINESITIIFQVPFLSLIFAVSF